MMQEELTEAQQNKAHWLWVWAKKEGMGVSRDEVKEIVRKDQLSPQLRSLWERGAAQQKLVIMICDAICEGSTASLKACHCITACCRLSHFRSWHSSFVNVHVMPQGVLEEHADAAHEVLSQGVYDLLMGRGPLHTAARMGNIDALQLMLDAGGAACIDAVDGNGLTALEVGPL